MNHNIQNAENKDAKKHLRSDYFLVFASKECYRQEFNPLELDKRTRRVPIKLGGTFIGFLSLIQTVIEYSADIEKKGTTIFKVMKLMT